MIEWLHAYLDAVERLFLAVGTALSRWTDTPPLGSLANLSRAVVWFVVFVPLGLLLFPLWLAGKGALALVEWRRPGATGKRPAG